MRHWYWVAFQHSAGFGGSEVSRIGPIASGADVAELTGMLYDSCRDRLPWNVRSSDIVVLTWTLLRTEGGQS